MEKLIGLKAREVLDSRGDPTVEVELETESHIHTISSVPSGASVGSHEAIELRDNDPNRYGGLGVLKAVENINTKILPALTGQDIEDQKSIDENLIGLDGTPHKSNLGANAILAISVAACKAAAIKKQIPLYSYIQQISQTPAAKIPVPMFNFIEGAKHADNNLEIQEFLVIIENANYREALRTGSELFHNLRKILKNRGLYIATGHEGGYAPNLPSDEDALKLLVETGVKKIGLDFAGVVPDKLPLETIITKYPVVSLEDPASEDNWDEWIGITAKYGGQKMVIGDDLYSTDLERLKEGIEKKATNGVIIKPNQIGTVTETINYVSTARNNGFKLIVSHRSGETEDSFIADFAVGIAADYAKLGAPARGERVSKYNRLARIEEGMQKANV